METSAASSDDAPSARARGLRWLILAALLLAGVIALLVILRPAAGPYVGWSYPTILGVYALAVVVGGMGIFYLLAGAPGGGPLRLVRTPLKILLVVGATVMIGVGELVLHAALTFDGDRESTGGEHHFDWD